MKKPKIMEKLIVIIVILLLIGGTIWLLFSYNENNKYEICCKKYNGTLFNYECPNGVCVGQNNKVGLNCDFGDSSIPVKLLNCTG